MVLEWLERTIRNSNHPNTDHENVRYSNGFGIRMFGIRAPTVVWYSDPHCIFISGNDIISRLFQIILVWSAWTGALVLAH